MTKRCMFKVVCLVLFIYWGIPVANGQADSLTITYKEYLENIISFHPLAKKAELRIKLAQAETLDAKGMLDPFLASDWDQKNFDDKLYYRQYQAKLKFPTSMGIAFTGGYENTEGVFLNPENSTDEFGLWHLGIEADVLQGLFVNERRIALDQAEVFQKLVQNEQQIMLNDLIYNASQAYLIWQQYQFFEEVLIENVSIANVYFENTKQTFFNGEKTAMDTLEAFILYQDAIATLQKNELGLIKSKRTVENYLWFNEVPIALQEETEPETYTNQIFEAPMILNFADVTQNPIILASINKLSYFEIEQRLKREKLKPKLKLKYNPLLSTSENSISPNYSISDYKWGIDFSMPILFRSARADVQRGEVKIQETKLDIQDKRNELQNKIENSWQQQQLYNEQILLIEKNLESYKRLLEGETEKFNYGESSVFLLNKRQEKYINGQLKLIEMYINQQLEMLKYLYFSNQLM